MTLPQPSLIEFSRIRRWIVKKWGGHVHPNPPRGAAPVENYREIVGFSINLWLNHTPWPTRFANVLPAAVNAFFLRAVLIPVAFRICSLSMFSFPSCGTLFLVRRNQIQLERHLASVSTLNKSQLIPICLDFFRSNF